MPIVPRHPDSEFKEYIYEQFSRIGKALSSPQRLIIMNVLCQGEHTVESLTEQTALSVANLSRHLQILKSVNLVQVQRRGKYMYYRIPDERTCRFYLAFRDFAADQLTEIQSALLEIANSPSRLDPVDAHELKRMIEQENTVLVDVRPEEEYRQGHLPGAVSMPLDRLSELLAHLPKQKPIVAYCRGKYCILADQAVELLRSSGFQARRADDGIVEWTLSGGVIERTDDDTRPIRPPKNS